jgi:hypothetical protein
MHWCSSCATWTSSRRGSRRAHLAPVSSAPLVIAAQQSWVVHKQSYPGFCNTSHASVKANTVVCGLRSLRCLTIHSI